MEPNTLTNCQAYVVNLQETITKAKDFLVANPKSYLYHATQNLQDRTEEVLKNLIFLGHKNPLPEPDLQANLNTKKLWKLLAPELQELAFQIEDAKIRGALLRYTAECKEYAYALKDTLQYQLYRPLKGFDLEEGTRYQITITLEDAEAESLYKRGMALMGFKALKSTPSEGANPTVWFSTKNFGQTIILSWTEKYKVYTSNQTGQAVKVLATSKYDADAGDVFTINSDIGTGKVTGGTEKNNYFTIDGTENLTKGLTVGLLQADPLDSTKMNPLCAIPIGPHEKVYVAPIQTVFLVFSTEVKETGTVIYRNLTRTLRVDLTDKRERELSYKSGTWEWGGEKWAGMVGDSDGPFIKPLSL